MKLTASQRDWVVDEATFDAHRVALGLPEAADPLAVVLAWIEAHPERLDQALWFTAPENHSVVILSAAAALNPSCGTAGCIAGWSVVLAGWEPWLDETEIIDQARNPRNSTTNSIKVIAENVLFPDNGHLISDVFFLDCYLIGELRLAEAMYRAGVDEYNIRYVLINQRQRRDRG